jgi:hypothetical protein
LDEQKFQNAQDYDAVKVKKEAMARSYNFLIEKHIKEAARITEMTKSMGSGNLVPVEGAEGLAASLIENRDELNIKRACFILYFAESLCYTTLFRQSLFGYHEKCVMDAVNLEYRQGENPKEKGCVMMLGAREWNKMVTELKRKLRSVKINFYKNSSDKTKPRNRYAVFYMTGGCEDVTEEEEVCGIFFGVENAFSVFLQKNAWNLTPLFCCCMSTR